MGKLLLLGASLGCLAPALTIGACLSYKTPFAAPFDQQDAALRAKQGFAAAGAPPHLLWGRAWSHSVQLWEVCGVALSCGKVTRSCAILMLCGAKLCCCLNGQVALLGMQRVVVRGSCSGI